MKPLKIGQFRNLIQLQHDTSSTQDPSGEPIPDWTTYATVWASFENGSGRAMVAGQQVNVEGSQNIRIRFVEGVLGSDRILFGTRIFTINSIDNNEERNREIIFNVKESNE